MEKTKVLIIECERGWGSRVDEEMEFDTLREAQDFVLKYNSENNLATPDWYMYATITR